MSTTTVISVRGKDQAALLADPDFVYVGRPSYRGVNWKGSIWANPFKVGISRRQAIAILGRDIDHEIRADQLNTDLAVRFYREYVRNRPELLGRIGELRGKVLGCWCLDWNGESFGRWPCHAVALAGLADRQTEVSQ